MIYSLCATRNAFSTVHEHIGSVTGILVRDFDCHHTDSIEKYKLEFSTFVNQIDKQSCLHRFLYITGEVECTIYSFICCLSPMTAI